jgi:hypothetical protein
MYPFRLRALSHTHRERGVVDGVLLHPYLSRINKTRGKGPTDTQE